MASDNPQTEVILYIKASIIDKTRVGSCPISQQWFLTCYSLHQRNFFNLMVKTVPPDHPPDDYIKLTTKKLPVIQIKSGSGPNGDELSGIVYEEIETFLDIWNCPQFQKNSRQELQAESVYQDLYKTFNRLLTGNGTEALVNNVLAKINGYLKDTAKTKFLVDDDLSYADCILIPKLQHLRVGADIYCGYQIPASFGHIWRYLRNVYETDAFLKSNPSNEDIAAHYEKKAVNMSRIGNPHLKKTLTWTKEVPEEILNGDA